MCDECGIIFKVIYFGLLCNTNTAVNSVRLHSFLLSEDKKGRCNIIKSLIEYFDISLNHPSCQNWPTHSEHSDSDSDSVMGWTNHTGNNQLNLDSIITETLQLL